MSAPEGAAQWLRHSVLPHLPAAARRSAARGYGAAVDAWVHHSGRRLQTGAGPIVLGPWLSEIGFEVLYWIPFLHWFLPRAGIDPARVIAVSRGGVESWYHGLAGGYLELLTLYSPAEFRARNEQRARLHRGFKSMRRTEMDAEIMRWVASETGEPKVQLLHPSLMFRLFRPYFWGDVSMDWVARHTVSRPWARPAEIERLNLPEDYVVAKLYFNDCFPASECNVAIAERILERLGRRVPVVLLQTAAGVDDHSEYDSLLPDGVLSVRADPVENLAVQSAVISGARACLGTYGGFSYLAPSYGVRSVGLYSDAAGYSDAHLSLARGVFAGEGFGSLAAYDVGWTSLDAIENAVLGTTAQ